MRIHVTKLNGEQIFGSLNIGKLTQTNIIRIDGKPVFLNENDELVYCEPEMHERIEERLNLIKMGA